MEFSKVLYADWFTSHSQTPFRKVTTIPALQTLSQSLPIRAYWSSLQASNRETSPIRFAKEWNRHGRCFNQSMYEWKYSKSNKELLFCNYRTGTRSQQKLAPGIKVKWRWLKPPIVLSGFQIRKEKKKTTTEKCLHGEWKRAERNCAKNCVYPSLACGELFANFKETPLFFISRRQINTKEKEGGKQKKRNGPIRHKSTDVLHVFRARLAWLSRPYGIMDMACTKRISHIWMGWCWILIYAQSLYKFLFKKLNQQKKNKKTWDYRSNKI